MFNMNTIIGLFAHVDAGKTTLAEAILFKTDAIKQFGRVDKKDSFLDYDSFERKKGITVLSKQARYSYKDKNYILVDTPGHLDFLSEVNRSSKIVDLAVLIIDSRNDIPQDVIKKYNYLRNEDIPIIIFVNKMDISFNDENSILNELRNKLSSTCLKHEETEEIISINYEDELNESNINSLIYESIKEGIICPVVFGSALKQEDILDLLNYIDKIEIPFLNSNHLKAYVYKVDEYTHLKVISGTLENKTVFNDERINEMYILNGENKTAVQSVKARDLCAVKGLKNIKVGTYLPSFFSENDIATQSLRYRLISDLDNKLVFDKISELNNEFPELDIQIEGKYIFINTFGELHKDYIKQLILDRYQIEINYSDPVIIYKETITKETVAIGHYEPLGHYGEVVLKIKPNKIYKVKCNEDSTNKNTIKSYFENYIPRGILNNSRLDNIEIEILDLKTSKHTQGQDLIEASKRALRNALILNESILLEPYYLTSISSSKENEAKLISLLSSNNYSFTILDNSILARIRKKEYNDFILKLHHNFKDELNIQIENEIYEESNNQNEIVNIYNYDYLNDMKNPCGSVFFINGQRKYIEPERVNEYSDLDINNYIEKDSKTITYNKQKISDDELKRVWNQLYKEKPRYKETKNEDDDNKNYKVNIKPIIYLIDGYNLMHAMDDIPLDDLMSAREKVIDLVCDYAGYIDGECILVFDAYKNEYSKPSVHKERNITIVYTKRKQTADMYIEKMSGELEDDYNVNVVTSDALEQLMIFSHHAYRLSSREFIKRHENFKKNHLAKQDRYINRPLEDLKKLLED